MPVYNLFNVYKEKIEGKKVILIFYNKTAYEHGFTA